MKLYLYAFALMLSAAGFSQKPSDQYSIEAGYGVGVSGEPGITAFSHFDAGFRYMIDEYWGLKFDFGSDRFRTGTMPQRGTDYNRFSVQIVHNLGRTLGIRSIANGNLGLLAHAGLGYSSLQSIKSDGKDNIGNIIIGLTPQVKIIDNLAIHLDTSMIFNYSQHINYDGATPLNDDGTRSKDAFTGTLFNASIGLTYYFGRHKSDSDWR